MDWCQELFKWPTVIWTGMITLIGITLTVLTFLDGYQNRQAKIKTKKRKH